MSEALAQIHRLLSQLTAEERRSLIPLLASFPDSGLTEYDLSEELAIIEQSHKIKPPQHNQDSNVLFELIVPMRNVVVIAMGGHPLLHVIFRPERFILGFPAGGPNLPKIVSDGLREDLFTGEKKEKIREQRRASGIVEDDAAFEQAITDTCDAIAKDIVKAKAERVSQLISLHLPRMVGDMFDAALQGQTFADLNAIARELGQPERQISASRLRRMLTERYWRDVKGHLGVKQGGPRNVKHTWTDEERECLATKYHDLRAVWIEAKRIVRTAQKSPEPTRQKEWRKEVLAVYEGLPEDLLERYKTPRADDAKPSIIAIIHAARLCVPNVELSPARLMEEVKKWKSKSTT